MSKIAKTALVHCLFAATLAISGGASAQSVTTVTSVSTSNAKIIYGNSVTISAFVSPDHPILSGTMAFFDGGNLILGASAVPLSNGVAVATTNSLVVGSDLITASYSGSTGFSASSGNFIETVLMANTALDLSTSANSVDSKGQLLLTAKVNPLDTPARPLGDVSFFDGSTLLGSESLNGGGVANFLLFADDLAIGPHTLAARYSGDIDFNGSAGRQSVTVTPLPEPASWGLMLTGFGIAGLMLRRKEAPGRGRPRGGGAARRL